MPAEIELNLETLGYDERIDARVFLDALDASTAILHEIDQELDGGSLSWYITRLGVGSGHATIVSEWQGGSPSFGSAAEIDTHRQRVVDAFVEGLGLLDEGAEWPLYFNDAAIKATERLVGAIRGDVTRITVSRADGALVLVTERVSANIKALTSGSYTEFGSVEGLLEGLSLAVRPTVRLRDEASGRSIEASFKMHQFDALRDALNHRVLLSGELVYTARGRLNALRSITSIRRLRESGDVGIDQVLGIAPDMTGDLSTEDFLDRAWDDRP
jgi:hypothetical protein